MIQIIFLTINNTITAFHLTNNAFRKKFYPIR
ncbi:MAG: hypothetical protein BWX49_01212 [Bacteroidetes bacterium ADurb.Bin008]|nr:MAG: hypothetical protein BWX49_01212 [Bacteroidetes bacterium ADurb.Bin008]